MLGNSTKISSAKSPRARIALFIGVGVAFGLILVGLWLFQRPAPQGVGATPFHFSLPDTSGRVRSLEEFSESRVFVHFWATWCPPCVDELPQVLAYAKQSPGDQVVLVSLDETWEKAYAILPRQGLAANVTALIDTTGKTANSWGSYQFPETYFLEPGLILKAKWVGPQDWLSLGGASKVR